MFSPTPSNNYMAIMEGRFIMYKLRNKFWCVKKGNFPWYISFETECISLLEECPIMLRGNVMVMMSHKHGKHVSCHFNSMFSFLGL